jgi:predicted transcriptional regulator
MSEELLRLIIGDIASNPNYGIVMKKWREMFEIKQGLISDELKVKQSVISDYENERCKNPGIKFVRKYSLAIIKIAKSNNYQEYSNVLKRLKIKDVAQIIEKLTFKKYYSNKDFLKILKASQLIMPENELKVNNCVFFLDNASKLLTNQPSYKLINNVGKKDTLFVFLNVKSGNFPVILINLLLGKNKNDSKKILLFQSEKLKLSWIAKRIAKSNNLSIIWTKKSKEKLFNILKKL